MSVTKGFTLTPWLPSHAPRLAACASGSVFFLIWSSLARVSTGAETETSISPAWRGWLRAAPLLDTNRAFICFQCLEEACVALLCQHERMRENVLYIGGMSVRKERDYSTAGGRLGPDPLQKLQEEAHRWRNNAAQTFDRKWKDSDSFLLNVYPWVSVSCSSCSNMAVMQQREDLHEQVTGSAGIGRDGLWRRTGTLLLLHQQSSASAFTGQDEGRTPNNSYMWVRKLNKFVFFGQIKISDRDFCDYIWRVDLFNEMLINWSAL